MAGINTLRTEVANCLDERFNKSSELEDICFEEDFKYETAREKVSSLRVSKNSSRMETITKSSDSSKPSTEFKVRNSETGTQSKGAKRYNRSILQYEECSKLRKDESPAKSLLESKDNTQPSRFQPTTITYTAGKSPTRKGANEITPSNYSRQHGSADSFGTVQKSSIDETLNLQQSNTMRRLLMAACEKYKKRCKHEGLLYMKSIENDHPDVWNWINSLVHTSLILGKRTRDISQKIDKIIETMPMPPRKDKKEVVDKRPEKLANIEITPQNEKTVYTPPRIPESVDRPAPLLLSPVQIENDREDTATSEAVPAEGVQVTEEAGFSNLTPMVSEEVLIKSKLPEVRQETSTRDELAIESNSSNNAENQFIISDLSNIDPKCRVQNMLPDRELAALLFDIYLQYLQLEILLNRSLFINSRSTPPISKIIPINYASELHSYSTQFATILAKHCGPKSDHSALLLLVYHLKYENVCVYAWCLLRLLKDCCGKSICADKYLRGIFTRLAILHYINPRAYKTALEIQLQDKSDQSIDHYFAELKKANEENVKIGMQHSFSHVHDEETLKDLVLRRLLCGSSSLGHPEPLMKFAGRVVLNNEESLTQWSTWNSTTPNVYVNASNIPPQPTHFPESPVEISTERIKPPRQKLSGSMENRSAQLGNLTPKHRKQWQAMETTQLDDSSSFANQQLSLKSNRSKPGGKTVKCSPVTVHSSTWRVPVQHQYSVELQRQHPILTTTYSTQSSNGSAIRQCQSVHKNCTVTYPSKSGHQWVKHQTLSATSQQYPLRFESGGATDCYGQYAFPSGASMTPNYPYQPERSPVQVAYPLLTATQPANSLGHPPGYQQHSSQTTNVQHQHQTVHNRFGYLSTSQQSYSVHAQPLTTNLQQYCERSMLLHDPQRACSMRPAHHVPSTLTYRREASLYIQNKSYSTRGHYSQANIPPHFPVPLAGANAISTRCGPLQCPASPEQAKLTNRKKTYPQQRQLSSTQIVMNRESNRGTFDSPQQKNPEPPHYRPLNQSQHQLPPGAVVAEGREPLNAPQNQVEQSHPNTGFMSVLLTMVQSNFKLYQLGAVMCEEFMKNSTTGATSHFQQLKQGDNSAMGDSVASPTVGNETKQISVTHTIANQVFEKPKTPVSSISIKEIEQESQNRITIAQQSEANDASLHCENMPSLQNLTQVLRELVPKHTTPKIEASDIQNNVGTDVDCSQSSKPPWKDYESDEDKETMIDVVEVAEPTIALVPQIPR